MNFHVGGKIVFSSRASDREEKKSPRVSYQIKKLPRQDDTNLGADDDQTKNKKKAKEASSFKLDISGNGSSTVVMQQVTNGIIFSTYVANTGASTNATFFTCDSREPRGNASGKVIAQYWTRISKPN